MSWQGETRTPYIIHVCSSSCHVQQQKQQQPCAACAASAATWGPPKLLLAPSFTLDLQIPHFAARNNQHFLQRLEFWQLLVSSHLTEVSGGQNKAFYQLHIFKFTSYMTIYWRIGILTGETQPKLTQESRNTDDITGLKYPHVYFYVAKFMPWIS